MSPPDYLYKYQALSAYSLASLTNGTIWAAKPNTFNDPFDCAITLDREKAVSDVMKRLPAGLKPESLQSIFAGTAEAFEKLQGKVRGIVQEIGICSFSAIPNHLLLIRPVEV